MKKLISVFAAMALVGSVAAAPKKAPAKAPAKAPVVAAPAAVTAVAAVAPKSSGKGVGLSVEGYGLFTLSNGSTTSRADGDNTATARTYELSNASGFGGGGSVGFDIVEKLSLQASFDFRSIKSREWSATGVSPVDNTATGTNKITLQNKRDTMWIGLGLRPRIEAGPGYFYAGAGVALVLPWKDTSTIKGTSAAGTVIADQTSVTNWNLAIGGYGELGYHFKITDLIYIGIGGRLLVATSNNDGKTNELTNNLTGVTTTTNYAKSYDTTDATKARYASEGITDISANVTVGVRF